MVGPAGAGATQLTVTWVLPATPVTLVGGGPTGVTGALGADGGLLPSEAVVATTVNV